MAKLVSKTYGTALFELAIEENLLDEITEEVRFVMDTLHENDELMKLLHHPKIAREEKIKVVENIFKGRLSDAIVGFLVLVIEKGRNAELMDIFEYFLDEAREYKNIGVAHVTSATELSEEQKKAVENKLLSVTQYVAFEMNYQVDAALIGGMTIRIGDRIVDSSIRTRLDKMAKALLAT